MGTAEKTPEVIGSLPMAETAAKEKSENLRISEEVIDDIMSDVSSVLDAGFAPVK